MQVKILPYSILKKHFFFITQRNERIVIGVNKLEIRISKILQKLVVENPIFITISLRLQFVN